MKQPHEILDIERDAPPETVKRAYLRLAQALHPDAGGSKDKFVQLHAAYEAMTRGQAPASCAQSAEPSATKEEPTHAESWRSYEEIMKACREELDRLKPRYRTPPRPRSTHELCWAIVLTPVCAGGTAYWLCYDGQSCDLSLWTFSFPIALLGILCVSGLAVSVGSTPVTNRLALYSRLLVFFLIMASLPLLFTRPQGAPPVRRDPLISHDLVPTWWPVPSVRVP